MVKLPEKYDTDAGAVVANSKNEFLLMFKRGYNYWEFPKGHMEGIELEELKTMDREVKEETGIKNYEFVEGFRHVMRYTYNKEGVIIHKTVTMFLIRTDDPVEINIEHKEFKWVSYEEALKMLKHEGQKEMIKEAYEFLREK